MSEDHRVNRIIRTRPYRPGFNGSCAGIRSPRATAANAQHDFFSSSPAFRQLHPCLLPWRQDIFGGLPRSAARCDMAEGGFQAESWYLRSGRRLCVYGQHFAGLAMIPRGIANHAESVWLPRGIASSSVVPVMRQRAASTARTEGQKTCR